MKFLSRRRFMEPIHAERNRKAIKEMTAARAARRVVCLDQKFGPTVWTIGGKVVSAEQINSLAVCGRTITNL